MKPALAFRQPEQPDSWSQVPSGEQIKREIESHLNDWLPRMFGYYALKIGPLSHQLNMERSLIKRCLSVKATFGDEAPTICGDMDDLPFVEHGVDACILSHCLEFSVDPHHIVREANRVLIPNGYLVITGYNPLSLAGINKLIPYRRKKSPWQERFFTPMRVKDWLHLMGYEILQDSRFLHHSLTRDNESGFINRYWQSFAEKYLPSLGSVYFIIAKKRMLPLTPIRPKWKVRPKFEPVKVSSRNQS